MKRIASIGFVLAAFLGGDVRAENLPAAAAFERLRSLAGDWEGPFEWSGARSGSGRMSASYLLSGNGSALVETLAVDGTPSMTSVYHLDGSDLRMTHFCAARNQPRLKATRIDEAQGIFEFAIVDITNLPSPTAPHVEGFEIRFLKDDEVRLTFIFVSDAGRSYERIALTRLTRVRR
jgi:hypothetical protein